MTTNENDCPHCKGTGKIGDYARFSQMRNDLIWEYYDYPAHKFIRWYGYDDRNWWENVSITDMFQIRDGWRLDPVTNKVTKI